jgi:hypothetical protein
MESLALSPSNSNSSLKNIVMGDGFLSQLLLALAAVFAIFFLFLSLEFFYSSISNVTGRNIELFPFTASSEDKQVVIRQDTKKYPQGKQIPFSVNERTGTEFSYSFYLYVNPSTFNNSDTLATVFYKGYLSPWPLMGPGVFLKRNSNTLRVFMNSYTNPYMYCDVENIPVSKWFHVVVSVRKNSMEVYVNGNLTKKMSFENGMPYQNFQDVVFFNQSNFTLRGSTTPAVGDETFEVRGVFKGNLSAVTYFSYALSYTEIQSLMNMGPSKKVLSATQELPPYFADQWWTTSYTKTEA